MNIHERAEIANEVFKSCMSILNAKGLAYAGEDNISRNFKRNADALGLTKYQVWGVYAGKHWDSIVNAIKDNPNFPEEKTEGLGNRIIDLINYLVILKALEAEDGQKEEGSINPEFDITSGSEPTPELQTQEETLLG